MAALLVCVIDAAYILSCFPQLLVSLALMALYMPALLVWSGGHEATSASSGPQPILILMTGGGPLTWWNCGAMVRFICRFRSKGRLREARG